MAALKAAAYALVAKYGYNKAISMIKEVLGQIKQDQWDNK